MQDLPKTVLICKTLKIDLLWICNICIFLEHHYKK